MTNHARAQVGAIRVSNTDRDEAELQGLSLHVVPGVADEEVQPPPPPFCLPAPPTNTHKCSCLVFIAPL